MSLSEESESLEWSVAMSCLFMSFSSIQARLRRLFVLRSCPSSIRVSMALLALSHSRWMSSLSSVSVIVKSLNLSQKFMRSVTRRFFMMDFGVGTGFGLLVRLL